MERESDWELDLLALLRALWRQRLALLVAVALGAELCLWLGTALLPPRYVCRSLLYVKNSGDAPESATISSGELSAAKSLVDSYGVILHSRSTLEQVIQREQLAYRPEELAKLLSCRAVDGTEFFQLQVQSSDPEEALAIANCLSELLPEQLRQVAGAAAVSVLDAPALEAEPSWPQPEKLALLGSALGLGLCALVLSFRELRYGCLYREDRASFPAVGAFFLSLPPNSKEADYQLLELALRARLEKSGGPTLLALAPLEENAAMAEVALGLGKAYGQRGQRVLLVECNPSCGLGKRLGLPGQAGLCQLAQGRRTLEELLCKSTEAAVDGLPAGGELSPAEMEGATFEKLLAQDRGRHELLLLLLPPLDQGSEAYALAMNCQGLVLLGQEGHSRRAQLRESLRRLEDLRIPLLGLVLRSRKKGVTQRIRWDHEA